MDKNVAFFFQRLIILAFKRTQLYFRISFSLRYIIYNVSNLRNIYSKNYCIDFLNQGKSSIIEIHIDCIPNRQENMCQATDECSLRSPMKPQLSSRFSIITSSINTRNNSTLIFRLCSVCPLYSFSNWDASSIICENFLTYTHETLFVAKSSLSLTPSKQIFSFASF